MTKKEAEGEAPKSKMEKLQEKFRKEIGEGMIEKVPAEELTPKLLERTLKDTYIIFDFNHGWQYGEKLKAAGYKGIFAEKWAFTFERERETAQLFVKKHYPNVRLPEQYKVNYDKMLYILKERNDKIWVLKFDTEDLPTFVPQFEEPALAIEETMQFIDKYVDGIKKTSILMQEKIIGSEVVVETIYSNGKPLYSNCDWENKPLFPNEKGEQTGCVYDLVKFIPLNAPIRQTLNQPFDKIAQKQKLTTIMDMAVIISHKDGLPYFLEFCPGRFGYNALFNELEIVGVDRIDEFLISICEGEPIDINEEKFAASLRLFNLNYYQHLLEELLDEGKEHYLTLEQIIEGNTWLWAVKKMKDGYYLALSDYNVAIITAQSDTPEGAVKKAMRAAERNINFDGKYFRSDFDEFDLPYNPVWRYYFCQEKKLLQGGD
jgi:phosphoribosylamine-glycine ligase